MPSAATSAATTPSSPSIMARRNAACTSRSASIGIDRRARHIGGGARFLKQDRERWQRLVPFDQARHHAAALERAAIELPDRGRDGRGVVVDEQRLATAHDAGVTGEVDLADG